MFQFPTYKTCEFILTLFVILNFRFFMAKFFFFGVCVCVWMIDIFSSSTLGSNKVVVWIEEYLNKIGLMSSVLSLQNHSYNKYQTPNPTRFLFNGTNFC